MSTSHDCLGRSGSRTRDAHGAEVSLACMCMYDTATMKARTEKDWLRTAQWYDKRSMSPTSKAHYSQCLEQRSRSSATRGSKGGDSSWSCSLTFRPRLANQVSCNTKSTYRTLRINAALALSRPKSAPCRQTTHSFLDFLLGWGIKGSAGFFLLRII